MLRRGAFVGLVALLAACGLSITGTGVTPEQAEAGSGPTDDAAPLGDDDDIGQTDGGDLIEDANVASVDAGTLFGEDEVDAEAGLGPAPPTCKKTAWLLVDNDASSLNAAYDALTKAELTVTKIADYSTYDGADLAGAAPGVIVFMPALHYYVPSVTLQTNIKNALRKGTGFVAEEWAGYLVHYETTMQTIAPYILFNYSSHAYDLKLTLAAATPSHAIWTGLPQTFTTNSPKLSIGTGTQRPSSTAIASLTGAGVTTQAAVLVKESGPTRVAGTSLAPGYHGDKSLANDTNIAKLYANMALWAAHCLPLTR